MGESHRYGVAESRMKGGIDIFNDNNDNYYFVMTEMRMSLKISIYFTQLGKVVVLENTTMF